MRTVNLTEKQRDFVVHLTSTPGAIGNAAQAARLAGYSEKTAKEQGCQLLNLPHVREAIDEANREQLSGRIAVKAVGLLERAIDDEGVPMRVRVDAARTVLDRAGIMPPTVAERDAKAPPDHKKLAEMSLAELHAFIAKEKKALADLEDATDEVVPIETARQRYSTPGAPRCAPAT